jgi:glycyl-tRNA synthetase
MATVSTQEDEYFALKAKVTLQASVIKQMKKEGAPADAIAAEVQVLGNLRQQLFELAGGEKPITEGTDFNRKGFDELLLRKMYVVPSFEIHNGPAGLFDYGPAACALKANILALWRQHFVLEENMLEMECTNLTPSSVLETSGHVERFTDFMVRDVKSGECFRADKLLEDAIDNFLKAHPNMPPDEQEDHRIVQVDILISIPYHYCNEDNI